MKNVCRRIGGWILAVLPHVTMVMGLIVVVLFVTDRFNRAMGFMTSSLSKGFVLAFALLVIVQSVIGIVRHRRGNL